MSDDDILCLDDGTSHLATKYQGVSSATTSTDQIKPKKKKRTPEEIEAEKKQKLVARNRRVVDSSTNSNAEKYVYCHIGRDLLNYTDGLESSLKLLLDDRTLSFDKQLVIDDHIGMTVRFYREFLDVDEEGEMHSCMMLMPKSLLIIPSDEFKRLIGVNFVDAINLKIDMDSISIDELCLICYGPRQLSQSLLFEHELDIYEKIKAQIICAKDADELSMFIVQMFRGYANRIKAEHRFRNTYATAQVVKGIVHGDKQETVLDWWDKMLQMVPRLADSQRRAIASHIPDPVAAIRSFTERSREEVIEELANVSCESGKRIGPSLARKIFLILTDCTGQEVIE